MLKEPVALNIYNEDGTVKDTFKLCIIPWGMMKKVTEMQDKIEKAKDDDTVLDEMGNFLCEIYRDQFTVDELNEHADSAEVIDVIHKIMDGTASSNPN